MVSRMMIYQIGKILINIPTQVEVGIKLLEQCLEEKYFDEMKDNEFMMTSIKLFLSRSYGMLGLEQ